MTAKAHQVHSRIAISLRLRSVTVCDRDGALAGGEDGTCWPDGEAAVTGGAIAFGYNLGHPLK